MTPERKVADMSEREWREWVRGEVQDIKWCLVLVGFLALLATLAGCGEARAQVPLNDDTARDRCIAKAITECGSDAPAKARVCFKANCGVECQCVPKRKPRARHCFKLAETCEWPSGAYGETLEAVPKCDEFCVRGELRRAP